jgi:signal transduction histidine kinase
VSFKVEPRFWQAWWFHLGAGSIGLLAVFSAYRYRLRRIRAVMNLRFEERLAERTRIAQELHDTLLQGFVSASMQLEVAADLLPENAASRPLVTRALELMQQVIDEGRNAVRGLRAHGVGSTPLETALSQIRHEVDSGQSTGFRIAVQGRRRELHPLLQDEVYRIAREALMNAFRHSGARQIEVELNYAADQFRLYVRDDGVGIDTDVLESGRDGHWGLIGMRERAESIGAQLHVFTRASAGTEVVLEVPSKVAFHSSAVK